ncbi:hypothetical protein BJ944DRAFT_239127 [Cunninghamella echinulata]|nr:hypothetical protein BJ944DRAFT_239127 [Cunninghamella echinulata]
MDRLHYNVGFRLYVGNSNWINLSPKMTADFIEIWKKGQPTKYKLAPGLSIDILPNDVDCNSKTTDLPMLMRADLCYDKEAMYEHINDDDNSLNNKDKNNNYITLLQQPKTLNERKEIVQQRLSLFVKNILDSQGIIDAFPPASSSDDILPPIFNIPTHRHLGLIPVIARLAKRITSLKVVPSPSTNESSFYTTFTSFPPSSHAYTEPTSIQSENHHQLLHHNNKKDMNSDNNKSNSKKGKGKIHSTSNHKLYRKSKNIKKKLINKKTQLAPSPYYFRASTCAASSLTTTEENNNTLTTSPTPIFMESTLTTLYNNNSDDQLNPTTTPDTTTSFDWLPTYSNPNQTLSYQRNTEVSLISHNNDNSNEDNNSDINERKSVSSITTRSIDSKTNDFFQPLDIGTPVLGNDSITPLINYHQINHHHHHHRRENEIKNDNNDTNHHQHNDSNNNIDSFWYDSTNEHQQQTIVSAQPNLLSSSPLPPIPISSSSSILYPTHHQHQRTSMCPSSEYSFNTYPNQEYHNLQTNTSHYNSLRHSPTLCHYQGTSDCEQSSMTYLFHSTHKLTNETNHPSVRTKSLRRPSIESAVTF